MATGSIAGTGPQEARQRQGQRAWPAPPGGGNVGSSWSPVRVCTLDPVPTPRPCSAGELWGPWNSLEGRGTRGARHTPGRGPGAGLCPGTCVVRCVRGRCVSCPDTLNLKLIVRISPKAGPFSDLFVRNGSASGLFHAPNRRNLTPRYPRTLRLKRALQSSSGWAHARIPRTLLSAA